MKSKSEFSSMGFGPTLDGLDPTAMMQSLQNLQQTWFAAAAGDSETAASGIAELDKRINDLQAVEQWLLMNISMLRATVQGLQVQRTSLAALSDMGESWQQATQPPSDAAAGKDTAHTQAGADSAGDRPTGANPTPAVDPMAMWNLLRQQFETIAGAALATATEAADADKKRQRSSNND